MSGFRKRQSVAGLQRPKGESSCCRIVWSGSSNQSTSAWREVGLRKWTSLAAPIGEQRINDLAGVYFCIDQRTQAGQRANDQRTSLLAPPFAVHLYRLRTRNVRIDPTSEAAQGQPRPGGYPVIIRMVAISSAPTGRGSWSRRNIVRFHLRLLSRLNHRRHPRRVSL